MVCSCGYAIPIGLIWNYKSKIFKNLSDFFYDLARNKVQKIFSLKTFTRHSIISQSIWKVKFTPKDTNWNHSPHDHNILKKTYTGTRCKLCYMWWQRIWEWDKANFGNAPRFLWIFRVVTNFPLPCSALHDRVPDWLLVGLLGKTHSWHLLLKKNYRLMITAPVDSSSTFDAAEAYFLWN